ncbi:MAG: hypothetical protein U0L79_07720 [Lachnospiraceae bacterium]|nr:hypothetical protein [Lachnospiraceae bacterium]
MEKHKLYRYYGIQVIKSLLTVLACFYLVQFDDTRVIGIIIGCLSSVMLFSWIMDYVMMHLSMKHRQRNNVHDLAEFNDED